MISRADTPCYECPGHSPTCHSGCARYDEYRRKVDARKKARNDYIQKYLSVMEYGRAHGTRVIRQMR